LARIATPLGKFWICKRTPAFVNEAQECLGGAGYVEESMLPRLYREAPLNSIWEGSGNVQCLDVLRALARDAECAAAFFAELHAARGGHRALDGEVARLRQELRAEADPALARALTERAALALQASLLVRAGPGALSDAFCESRLGPERGRLFGTLAPGAALDVLIERAWPGR
jgi:putative acyl-CoA dehydrogenase